MVLYTTGVVRGGERLARLRRCVRLSSMGPRCGDSTGLYCTSMKWHGRGEVKDGPKKHPFDGYSFVVEVSKTPVLLSLHGASSESVPALVTKCDLQIPRYCPSFVSLQNASTGRQDT